MGIGGNLLAQILSGGTGGALNAVNANLAEKLRVAAEERRAEAQRQQNQDYLDYKARLESERDSKKSEDHAALAERLMSILPEGDPRRKMFEVPGIMGAPSEIRQALLEATRPKEKKPNPAMKTFRTARRGDVFDTPEQQAAAKAMAKGGDMAGLSKLLQQAVKPPAPPKAPPKPPAAIRVEREDATYFLDPVTFKVKHSVPKTPEADKFTKALPVSIQDDLSVVGAGTDKPLGELASEALAKIREYQSERSMTKEEAVNQYRLDLRLAHPDLFGEASAPVNPFDSAGRPPLEDVEGRVRELKKERDRIYGSPHVSLKQER